jgi:hypothetical protein
VKPKPSSTTTIDQAIADTRLLGAALQPLATWQTWGVALKAAFGMALTDAEIKTFHSIAGNRAPPTRRLRELWAVCGRRSGKSRMAAAIAVYLALFGRYRLSPGERGMCLVVAASVDQAKAVFEYIIGFLQSTSALRKEIATIRSTEVELRNGIIIAVHACSFRTVRGRTLVACVFDEAAFWRDESSAAPDVEMYRAVRPALVTTAGMLIGISTPYRKAGLLYQKHKQHFAVDGDVLVVQGASEVFNPTLEAVALAEERAADPAAAVSEWDAQFRADLSAYLDDATVDRAIDYDRPLELPPREGVLYEAFTDAAAGGGDAYTFGIGHQDGDNHIADVVRGTHGAFDPQEVTRQYAELCRAYRIHTVTGDNYAKDWVQDAWRKNGIEYVRSPKVKADIYLEALPLFTRGLVRLPNLPRLVRELRLLERQTHRSGKDTVLHPRGEHDDHANVACGVLWRLDHMARVAAAEPNIHPPPDFSTASCGPLPGSMNDSWSPPYNW